MSVTHPDFCLWYSVLQSFTTSFCVEAIGGFYSSTERYRHTFIIDKYFAIVTLGALLSPAYQRRLASTSMY